MAFAIRWPTRLTISALSFVLGTTLLSPRNCLYWVIAICCISDSETSESWFLPVMALRLHEKVIDDNTTNNRRIFVFINKVIIEINECKKDQRLLFCLLMRRRSRCFKIGTLLSVPLSKRFIFFWCVSITINATATENILYSVTSSLKIKSINTANATLDRIELSETNLVKYNTNKNTPTQHTATIG